MERFGYARVSTREQNPDHQLDALLAAGIDRARIFIDKMSGKLASRPELERMLELLREGDQVTVTRLRRLGRSHDDLMELVRGFEDRGVDFVVIEQGIDTSTPIGRFTFHIFAALAEYDRELIVEGTLDGLAAARARGRVGGRPAKLTAQQLDQAQRLYDTGELTGNEIAAAFGVGRATLYRYLSPGVSDCALIVYRNSRPKVDTETNRRYGETGQSEAVQLEADRKWWNVAPARRPRLKAVVFVVDQVVTRVRAVDPAGTWHEDDRGYADIPMTAPLDNAAIDRELPTLPMRLGDRREHQRGKIREYVTL
ncbi:recombinase family protein (plasmid) [Kribbella sp. WER1]